MNQNFPDAGELIKATERKSDKLIFFVHFFHGHKKALKRHVEFVNELGYDAYIFNLKDRPKQHSYVPYSTVSKKFGMKHVLADQIEHHLDLLSDYNEKIMFAFSNVAGSAIETMARRFKNQPNEIKAMICDSGPGAKIIQASYKLLDVQMGMKSTPLRLITTPLFVLGWSKEFHKDLHPDLEKFPEKFPLLSIRGWRDKMITPSSIDDIFEPHQNINWKKLSLPEAGHLNGLRDFPSEYKPALADFLQSIK